MLCLRPFLQSALPLACGRLGGRPFPPLAATCVRNFARPAKRAAKQAVTKNEDIRSKEVRLIYIDKDGENQNEVMLLKKAIEIAGSMNKDVIQVASKEKPPVCRVDDAGKVLMEKKKKAKLQRSMTRSKAVKEMVIGAGIDSHDLEMKMKKVRSFLGDGHQVRLQVLAKRGNIQKNPRAVQDATLKVLDALDGHVGAIMQSQKAPNPNSSNFTVSPPQEKK